MAFQGEVFIIDMGADSYFVNKHRKEGLAII